MKASKLQKSKYTVCCSLCTNRRSKIEWMLAFVCMCITKLVTVDTLRNLDKN